jgi:hypothetical protein
MYFVVDCFSVMFNSIFKENLVLFIRDIVQIAIHFMIRLILAS